MNNRHRNIKIYLKNLTMHQLYSESAINQCFRKWCPNLIVKKTEWGMMLLCWPHRTITMRRLWETRDQKLCWRTVCGSLWAEGRLTGEVQLSPGLTQEWWKDGAWAGPVQHQRWCKCTRECKRRQSWARRQSFCSTSRFTAEPSHMKLHLCHWLSLKDRHPEEASSSCSFTSGGDSWGSLNIWIGCLLHLLPPQADFVWAEQF